MSPLSDYTITYQLSNASMRHEGEGAFRSSDFAGPRGSGRRREVARSSSLGRRVVLGRWDLLA
jgi:hypothetical protein